MNSGHSEKGREFCIRTETCLIDRDCSILTVPSPHPQSGLPLVKSSLVHQVGGVVGAGEGVVDGLVLHNHCAVVRHNVAVEVVDGGLVLEEGRRQKGLRILGKVVDEELGEKNSKKLSMVTHDCHPNNREVEGCSGVPGTFQLHGQFEASLNYCLEL